MASLQPYKLSVAEVSSLLPLLSAVNLHWWTTLVIKFTAIVNLTWFTVAGCNFSCIPEFHSTSQQVRCPCIPRCVTEPVSSHLLFSSSKVQCTWPVVMPAWEQQSQGLLCFQGAALWRVGGCAWGSLVTPCIPGTSETVGLRRPVSRSGWTEP